VLVGMKLEPMFGEILWMVDACGVRGTAPVDIGKVGCLFSCCVSALLVSSYSTDSS
jgi:hypothetical protein